MFLLRAAFWLMVVAVLMPREPDLGLGNPAELGCGAYSDACQDGQQWLHQFRAAALTSIARVRADLEANVQEVAPRG